MKIGKNAVVGSISKQNNITLAWASDGKNHEFRFAGKLKDLRALWNC